MASNEETPTPTGSETVDQSKIEVGRRAFIKATTFLSATSIPAVAGIAVTGQPVMAQATGDDVAETNDITNALGGVVDDVALVGNPNDNDPPFVVSWDNLVRGDVIQLELMCKPTHVSTPDGSGRDNIELGNSVMIGTMGVQVDKPNGTRDVTGRDFFENRSALSLTKHPDISLDTINVDLDHDIDITEDDDGSSNKYWDEIADLDTWGELETKWAERDEENNKPMIDSDSDSYVRVSVYEVDLYASIPDGDQTREKLGNWELIIVLNAELGFGMLFGEAFGAVSDPL